MRLLLGFLMVVSWGCKSPQANRSAILEANPDGAVPPREDVSYRSMNVSPDCSEGGFSFAQLQSLATSPQVNSQQDLLDQLPDDVMQTFTLMFRSESAQAEGVSAAFPGVVRMTQDGKLIFRYTCNRDVTDIYNKIEVIHYDDDAERFRYAEFDFSKSGEHRIHAEPDGCRDCHDIGGTGDPRPNWAMYPDWPGVFGSHDDFFPTGTDADVEHVNHAAGWVPESRQDERQKYQAFLSAKVKPGGDQDPCYTSLPWPKPFLTGEPIPPLYVNYPYGTYNAHAGGRIYALRPNLKFTEVLSKLLARRNTRKFRQHADYPKVRDLLAFEAARCVDLPINGKRISQAALNDRLTAALPAYKQPDGATAEIVTLRGRKFTHHDPRHPSSLAQSLYGVGVVFGMDENEWTLAFATGSPAFETGAGPGANRDFPADLPLTAYVQHEILSDAATKLGVAGRLSRGTGESDDFGEHFQCIDKLAGPTVFKTEADRLTVCKKIASAVGF